MLLLRLIQKKSVCTYFITVSFWFLTPPPSVDVRHSNIIVSRTRRVWRQYAATSYTLSAAARRSVQWRGRKPQYAQEQKDATGRTTTTTIDGTTTAKTGRPSPRFCRNDSKKKKPPETK